MLCSWGANNYGQLGHGHTEDALLPIAFPNGLLPEDALTDITAIGGGGGFSFILTGCGQVLTCGNNDRGQLGQTDSKKGKVKESVELASDAVAAAQDDSDRDRCRNETPFVFSPCLLPTRIKVTLVASGWDFMAALTDNGSVYSWGSNSFGQLGRQLSDGGKQSSLPGLVEFPDRDPQRHIAAGLRHALSVSVAGHVYAWGHGRKGQLGEDLTKNTSKTSVVYSPRKVNLPEKDIIKSVFAGMYHSGALLDTGDFYLWGSNTYGQCCVSPTEHTCVYTPMKHCVIDTNGIQEHIVEVCSGWTHLLALTDSGKLYSWGRNNLGQLGRHCTNAACDPSPQLVEGLTDRHIVGFACGSEHNIALTSDCIVYCWGWNEHGICATGNEENVPLPQTVSMLAGLGLNSVDKVGCGAGHTFCLGNKAKS